MLEIKCSKLIVSCIPQRLEFIWVKECRYINNNRNEKDLMN